MKFILGEKMEMTQRFSKEGEVVPCTVIQAGPCYVAQIKSSKKDGYQAIQIGYGEKKRLNKPKKGHLKNLPNLRYLREFRIKNTEEFKKEQKIDVSIFNQGDKVQVVGISKGKGFQGVVKRHGFAGSPATHGHKDQLRMPGSIGSTAPQRVFKGMKMAGRMGGERITVKNLKVVEVDKDNNLILIKGAIPGVRHSLVLISSEGNV